MLIEAVKIKRNELVASYKFLRAMIDAIGSRVLPLCPTLSNNVRTKMIVHMPINPYRIEDKIGNLGDTQAYQTVFPQKLTKPSIFLCDRTYNLRSKRPSFLDSKFLCE